MSGSFSVLSHTADTGIDVHADTYEELLEWAAGGMFSLMYDIGSLAEQRSVVVAAQAASRDELLVDVLSDLLYLSYSQDLIPCRFQTREASATDARLLVGVADLDPDLLHGSPIKAVTYHDLFVARQEDDSWRARIVFDV
jgi:SHS2 domain-containing protein